MEKVVFRLSLILEGATKNVSHFLMKQKFVPKTFVFMMKNI